MLRCNCENRMCQLHEPARCDQLAMVRCMYIGGVCLDCAGAHEQYLIPVDMNDRPTPTDWMRFRADTQAYLAETGA